MRHGVSHGVGQEGWQTQGPRGLEVWQRTTGRPYSSTSWCTSAMPRLFAATWGSGFGFGA